MSKKHDPLAERFAGADLANPVHDLPEGVRGCADAGSPYG